jgi:hypothetical protein
MSYSYSRNAFISQLPIFADLELDDETATPTTNRTNNMIVIDAETQTTLFYHPASNTFIENKPQFPTTYLKPNGITKGGIEIFVETTIKPNASTIMWNDGKTLKMEYATNAEIAKLLKGYVNAMTIRIRIETLQCTQILHFSPDIKPRTTKIFSNNDQEFIKKFC